MVSHLSGIATLTSQFVAQIDGTRARLYDTRKTTPGWRTLEKYAVRCGGGWNHRMGLHAAILIKDNHLAVASSRTLDPAAAVQRVRQFLEACPDTRAPRIIEVEVDSLEQLRQALAAAPDIILLDNMSPDELREAVVLRDATAPRVQLEASGGITLESIRRVAESGIDRIS